jgi:hypothetical protein
MFDGPTAAVIVSAILTVGGSVIVAILKLIPARSPSHGEPSNRQETRIALLENDFRNLGRSFDQLRAEIHEMRNELRQIAATGCRGRGARSGIDPAPE